MYFTVCVDHEGCIWVFGGSGKKTNCRPQKLLDIPPVLSVACGSSHTLIITNDNLWSFGNNVYDNYVMETMEPRLLTHCLKKHRF